MANAILGYGFAGVGAVVCGLSVASVRAALKINLPFSLSDKYILIAGVVLLAIGVAFSYRGSSGKSREVPIYHGDKVVGYRRTA